MPIVRKLQDRYEKAPRYYMVRSVKGTHPPEKKHGTLAEAMAEAARLSEKIGKPCTVLESVCRVENQAGKAVWLDVRPEA